MPPNAFYPNDVDHLLHLTEPTCNDYEAFWDLAARIALHLDPADLEWHFGPWIKGLIKREELLPLEFLFRGLLRHGTREQLASLTLFDLHPMLVSEHPRLKLLALDFLSGLPCPEE